MGQCMTGSCRGKTKTSIEETRLDQPHCPTQSAEHMQHVETAAKPEARLLAQWQARQSQTQ